MKFKCSTFICLISGLGNLLSFLIESVKYQVGGVRFLKESGAAEKVSINKGPTFLILIEVFHKAKDLVYLLDFVQRTRKGLVMK